MLRLFDTILTLVALLSVVFVVHLFATGEDLISRVEDEVGGVIAYDWPSIDWDTNIDLDQYTSRTEKNRSEKKNERRKNSGPDRKTGERESTRWKYVVIHHSGTEAGTVEGFDRYQRKKLGIPGGIKYHFVIGNGRGMPEGAVEKTSRWNRQEPGPLTGRKNVDSRAVGICLVGNFTNKEPGQPQLVSLLKLLRYLMKKYGISVKNIRGAREWNPSSTESPGQQFPVERVRSVLRKTTSR